MPVLRIDGPWPAPVPPGCGLPPHLRLLSGLLADAAAMHGAGRASGADIDLAMRLGAGHPQGPFEVLGSLGDADRAAFGGAAVVPAPPGNAPPAAAPGTWGGTVGLVGTGHMASGIAETVALAGFPLVAVARTDAAAARMSETVRASLDRSASRATIDAGAVRAALALITVTTKLAELSGTSAVIEAVAEDLAVKRSLFSALDAALPAAVPLATNTSSYRVADLATAVRPGRPVLAVHFFNPARRMRLVEVVAGGDGDGAAIAAYGWVRALGKVPVRCADHRGFIVNRLLIPYLNDAVRLVEAGVPASDIDDLMTSAAGHPMGPLALIDLIGLDVTAATLASLAESADDPRLRPAAMLGELVQAGRLGRKSGAGFHYYGGLT